MNKEALNGLFRPKGVAVIGASNKAGKIGYSVVEALKNGKYEGEIFPINPKEEIQIVLKRILERPILWMYRHSKSFSNAHELKREPGAF